MWCSDCQLEFSAVESAEIQVCPQCSFSAAHGNRPRRIPKLNPESTKPKIRIDSAHQTSAIPESPEDTELLSIASRWVVARSLTHVAIFGLLVFLCGQALFTWAFLVGHFVAWSIANFLSLTGVVISIVAVSVSLRRSEQRIEELARLVGRKEVVKRKRSKGPKADRSKNARK